MGRPFNVTNTVNMLTGGLSFLSLYSRNAFPSMVMLNGLVTRTLHKADKDKFRNKTPWNCASVDTQVKLSRACFEASEVVNVPASLTIADKTAKAFLDYFFVNQAPNPVIANTDPLFVPWNFQRLVVARDSVQAKGSQVEEDPFNFGNFDTVITFTDGLGVLPDLLTSDVFKVYPITANLLYKNVNSPLVGSDASYSIEYYVCNYNLEGQNYRIYPNNSFTTTSETAGTIKLITNYTGNAKVIWANYTNTTITPPTTALSGQGLLETYPITFNCARLSGHHLNSSFTGFYNAYELLNTYKDLTTLTNWLRYANALKYTAIAALAIDNRSYIYKKETYSNPLKQPGIILTANNTRNLTGLLTVTRDYSTGHVNKIKAVSSGSVTSIKLENIINSINSTQLSIEAASDIQTVLNITLSQSLNATDTTKDYQAQLLVPGTSTTLTEIFNRKNFIKFDSSKTIWNANNNTITPSVTGSGTVVISKIQTVIEDNINQWKPVVSRIIFNKSLITDTAIAILSGATFNNTIPKIIYSSTGETKIKVKNTSNNYFSFNLPSTYGNWLTLQIDISGLTNLNELSVESVQTGENSFQLFFIGSTPTTMPLGIVYKSSIEDKTPGIHTLWIGDCYAIGNTLETLPYAPGIAPESKEIFKSGSSYSKSKIYGNSSVVSQSPYHLQKLGYPEAVNNQLKMLSDAFDDYTNTQDANGLLKAVFVPAFWNNANFATDEGLKIATSDYYYQSNYFLNNSDDPDFDNFTAIAKTVENVSRYLLLNSNSEIAKKIVINFLVFIQKYYIDTASNQPPTTLLNPTSEFHNPENSALIGKIALFANLSGIESNLTTNVMEKAYDYVASQYVTTGDTITSMIGSWSKGQNTFVSSGETHNEYTTDYHSECISFLASLLKYGNNINYPYSFTDDTFPNITPDFIDNIKLPSYKNAVNKFTDNEQTILFSNVGTGLEMTLKYSLINAEKLQILVNFWKQQGGKAGIFKLPVEIWKHPDILRNALNLNNLKFTFADTLNFDIRVASKERGLWRLEIKLIQTVRKVYDKKRKFGSGSGSGSGSGLVPYSITPFSDVGRLLTVSVTYKNNYNNTLYTSVESGFGSFKIHANQRSLHICFSSLVNGNWVLSDNLNGNFCSFMIAFAGGTGNETGEYEVTNVQVTYD